LYTGSTCRFRRCWNFQLSRNLRDLPGARAVQVCQSVRPSASLLGRVLLCYITDRSQLRGGLLTRIEDALRAGIDLIQVREKDLTGRDLYALCQAALRLPNPHGTKILINARADVALASGAHGLHLPSNAPAPSNFRGILPADFLIGVSCHSLEEVCRAQAEGAGYLIFGPVFETPSKASYGPPQGIERLRQVCEAVDLPVLALGGIDGGNAASCLQAGAAGIAGISLFQKAEGLSAAVRAIRDLGGGRAHKGPRRSRPKPRV
jgi:thiamine-phosphate pyrophosphorylase